MEDVAPVLIMIAMMATLFGILYFYLSYRNKERMALIEAGADASLFQTDKSKKRTTPFLLSLGYVCVGFAVGITGGFMLERLLRFMDGASAYNEYPQAYFSMIFLFVGLGLIKAYGMAKKNEELAE